MSETANELEANKALVLRYQHALQAGDLEGTRACLAEDCVRVFTRPGIRADPNTVGRDEILGNLPHLALYQPGTLEMEVEHIVAEGAMVALQFVIRAVTAAGKPYENFYHFLFECHGGRITKFWEYCDTLYGAQLLRPEMFGQPAA